MVEEDKQLIKYLISPVCHYLEAMLLLKLPGAFHKGAATFDFLQNDFDHNDPKETKNVRLDGKVWSHDSKNLLTANFSTKYSGIALHSIGTFWNLNMQWLTLFEPSSTGYGLGEAVT